MRTVDTRRISVLLGGIAVVGVTTLSACSSAGEEPAKTTEPSQTAPSASSPAPSSPAPLSPTEKAPTLTPGGPNSFTPSVIAPPAPTALPGNVITGQ